MKTHENYILDKLKCSDISKTLLAYHEKQIRYLQHERLIHLIVMCLVSILFVVVLGVLIIVPSLLIAILTLILGVLDGFYLAHYYKLENTVQFWYKIENTMIKFLQNLGVNTL
jgi:type IV secretory pathway component VirB8